MEASPSTPGHYPKPTARPPGPDNVHALFTTKRLGSRGVKLTACGRKQSLAAANRERAHYVKCAELAPWEILSLKRNLGTLSGRCGITSAPSQGDYFSTSEGTVDVQVRIAAVDRAEDEAKAVVAYLKWMSAVDTNGFPAGFLSASPR